MCNSPSVFHTRNIESYEPVARNSPFELQSREVMSRCSESGMCFKTTGGCEGGDANWDGSSEGAAGTSQIRTVASFDLKGNCGVRQLIGPSECVELDAYPVASNPAFAGFHAQTKTYTDVNDGRVMDM